MKADSIFVCLMIILVEWFTNGVLWNSITTKLCWVKTKWDRGLCKLSLFS